MAKSRREIRADRTNGERKAAIEYLQHKTHSTSREKRPMGLDHPDGHQGMGDVLSQHRECDVTIASDSSLSLQMFIYTIIWSPIFEVESPQRTQYKY
eukprot:scaffold284849_cov28-Tisochrysis_lutea.AAC.4